MSKFDEAITKYEAQFEKLGQSFDADLLRKVTKGLGPSIYSNDASLVAASDKAELERVVNNFLVKKHGVDADKATAAVASVAAAMKPVRNKHRAVFYYMLVKDLGLEGNYN